MANWVIVAALGSILATVWLGWLLYRINRPPEHGSQNSAERGVADTGTDGKGGGD